MRRLFSPLVIGLIAICGCDSNVRDPNAAAIQNQETEADHADHGDEIPAGAIFEFSLNATSVGGENINLEALKGKVVIVDVWGTWCPPCRDEIPSFIKLQEKYGPQGFQMVGLNYENLQSDEAAKEKIEAFIKQTGINYPCIVGSPETREQIPDFEGFPTTLFIDKAGRVRLKVVGLHPYEDLEEVVTHLLAE
ncbi:MAG: TlpA disulfide reductase family protein [Pirellulaceae bacterium]